MKSWWIRLKKYSSKGRICLKDKYGFIYHICTIEYIYDIDDKYRYIYTPNYIVTDIVPTNLFQGIPGLNLDLRKPQYVRENAQPVFITERVPQPNREDYYDLLADVGLDYYEPILYLIRTKLQYFGDEFFMLPYEEQVDYYVNPSDSYINIIKNILANIALNNNVYYDGSVINDVTLFKILYLIYTKRYNCVKEQQQDGINKAKEEHKYRGRKEVKVDTFKFLDVLEKVNRKEITAKDGAKILGISIDKYYRFKKKLVEDGTILS